ncbi:hypothetical protein H7F51_16190 [Novosphingobium flavum]|uniref:Uncharacterized protein n=1 Tax=Novosphingobium flavum TaxID=1778672 RepID=A0A7X1FUG2_9SPHN|nr:hypothetical protein [Novosphingobium flavum]MBC2667059.1 hypothetical protein [Novosphingobium flavum]
MPADRPYQFNLAPQTLMQAINPWTWNFDGDQIGLVNIAIGETKHPELERDVLEEVGSYGRQIGHIGEALEVLIDHFAGKEGLTPAERDALAVVKGDLARIRQIKARGVKGKGAGKKK